MKTLSVFFPAYNEVGNIENTVTGAQAVLAKLPIERYEIIVIDDGSTDGTGALVDQLAAKHPQIRAIHHQKNRGYGAALVSGFTSAQYDWVAFTDSDGQFNFAEIQGFLSRADSYDAVLGYRIRRRDNPLRRGNAWAWGALMKANFGIRVRDIDCAFKLIRRASLNRILPLESSGAFISTELIVKLQRSGARITEIGVTHYPRLDGHPTGANLAVIKKAFVEMRQLRQRLKTK